ncbi:MAG TPA: hypothetical protein PK461_16820, partial [Alcaligenes faecalis]|nr:hypothetical protein [Alcaligenes faecalis]
TQDDIQLLAASHQWGGPSSDQVQVPRMPTSKIRLKHWIGLHYLDAETGDNMDKAEYEIHFEDGQTISGALDEHGRAYHELDKRKPVRRIIYKARPAQAEHKLDPLEKLLMAASTGPTSLKGRRHG